jgi:hypothetical protein
LEAVKHVLNKYSDSPQTAASAVAALYALTKDGQEFLKDVKIVPREIVVLGALQNAPLNVIDISQTRINIDHSSAEILKLALVIVGLDRAPENVFDPKFDNAQIVSALGKHDDRIVSQYSIWAIVENDNLDLHDLGVNLPDIEGMPTNVRSWLYRLVGDGLDSLQNCVEYVRLGAEDCSLEARTGAAIGLRGSYIDGLDPLILDWYYGEEEGDIQNYLLEHMVNASSSCLAYETHILNSYEDAEPDSLRRQRIETVAEGTPLYGELIRRKSDAPMLFQQPMIIVEGDLNMTNIKTGNIQGGAVAIGGDATNNAPTSNYYNAEIIELIKSEIENARSTVSDCDISEAQRRELEDAFNIALTSPEPTKIERVISILGEIGRVIGSATEQGAKIAKNIAAICAAAGVVA